MTFELVAIAILILLNGFFAGAEIATVSVRRSRIRSLTQVGNKAARLVRQSQEQPDRFLATIQVGVTLAGTTASVLAGSALVPRITPLLQKLGLSVAVADQVAVIGVVVLLSYLLLVIGELVPKYLAYSFPESLALNTAPVICVFARVVGWPVRLLSWSARLLLLPLGLVKRREGGGITEEEINLIIAEGLKEGRFEAAERDLIRGVFEFAETRVRQAMTPRTAIKALPLTADREQVLALIATSGFSRFPVFEGSVDNIKGILHSKDLIGVLADQNQLSLSELLRPVGFVPDSKRIPELLQELRREQRQMAIVLDEYGGTAGLITLEDILEEIVGEIRDEHDVEEEAFQLLDDQTCRVRARYPIFDFNRRFGVELPEDGLADTVGGYLFTHLGRLPKVAETIIIGQLEFRVLRIKGTRISLLEIRKLSDPAAEDPATA